MHLSMQKAAAAAFRVAWQRRMVVEGGVGGIDGNGQQMTNFIVLLPRCHLMMTTSTHKTQQHDRDGDE